MLDRVLDRLEEWLITTLMAAATVLTFVAVVHRYGASNAVVFSIWAKAQGLIGLSLTADWVYRTSPAINLSWAQELATYMFVWMAKFGAALGVRTGIHVGVDVLVDRLDPPARRPVDRIRTPVRRSVYGRHRHSWARSMSTSLILTRSRRNSSGRAG